MPCDCQDKRWVKWVRVKIENKAVCSICHRDIPINEVIEAEEAEGYLDSFDLRGGGKIF